VKAVSILIVISLLSLNAFGEEVVVKKKKKKVKADTTAKVVPEKPCDSKEDILKKLEAKKQEQLKEQAAKPKGFSLQGGDTGCTIK
jgi:hypothetical protein